MGAITATCPPFSAAPMAAYAATAVLPEPTSPCSSRRMGRVRPRSARISPTTLAWASVSSKGKRDRMFEWVAALMGAARAAPESERRRA